MQTKAIYLAAFIMLATVAHDAVAQPTTTPDNPDQPSAGWSRKIVLKHFVVSLIDDTKVAAQEEGVLLSLDAKEGQIVKKDEILARLDDSDAKIRRIIAENELKVAVEQAESDADVKAAKATVKVAEAEYDKSRDMTDRAARAISEFELRRLRLTHERSIYQSANAEVEHRINQLTLTMKEAQLRAVDREIERRQVKSPISGVVVKRHSNLGDWVKVGEPIYRVVRMGRLRVEGLLSADRFTPAQVEGKRVDLRIEIPDANDPNRKETIRLESLKIDFASPVVDASRDFLVFADFDNPLDEQGHWLVRPGLEAEITIYLDPVAHPATARR